MPANPDDGGLNVHPGPDQDGYNDTYNDVYASHGDGVDTPDPFATAVQGEYDGSQNGVDENIKYLPPWALTRAPGTREPVYAGEIVPIDPWKPGIALLNGQQLAMLNRESAARQAASYWITSAYEV